MRTIIRLFTIIITLFLISCGSTLPKLKPYKMDIQQGNVVTSEMLLKLRPGMTKSQVKFIMGTPLLVDSFRTNRWDYFYQLRKQGKIVKQHRVILDFENDLLKRVRGDVVPKGQTAEDVAKKLQEEAKAKLADQEPSAQQASDSNEPKVLPIEMPGSEETDQMGEDTVSETPPSVLAVPLATEPVDTPEVAMEPASTESPSTKLPVQSMDAAEEEVAPEVSQAKPEEKAKAVVEQQEAAVETVEKVEVPAREPIEVAPSPAPVVPLENQKPSNKKVFRLDRSLDATRIKTPAEAEQVSTESAVTEVVDSTEETLPEEAPSFFERMLEKIGF